jgi:NAD(P)-dependent dehydrogenase (short-subunit alcohol dehydrogenase family)
MENLPVDHFVTNMQFTAQTHRDVYTAIDPTKISQKGKVVIITGASQGLGAQAFAPSFAAAGPKAIVLVARNADKLQEVADTLAKSHPDVETLVVPTDIGDPASVAALFDKVKEKYGHADVLVNNAAVFEADQPVKDVDQQLWWDEMVRSLSLHHFHLFTFSPPSPFLLPSPFLPPSPHSTPTLHAYH